MMSPDAAKKIIKSEREKNRIRVANWRNKHKVQSSGSSKADVHYPYKSSNTLGKATAKARRSLPTCPEKKRAVLRKLLEEEGLDQTSDSQVAKRRSQSSLSPDVINAVQDFYSRDDISRQAPGLKDYVTITSSDGTKEKVQSRHLYASIKETYAMFVKENSKIIGKSKFAELRPKHVLLSNKLPHNVCLCRYHENFIMAVNKFNSICPTFQKYDHTFVSSFLCKPPKPECYLRKCNECLNKMKDKLVECVEAADETPDQITWDIWKDVNKKLLKVTESGTLIKLMDHILEMTTQFFEHCYFKRNQAQSYQIDKEAISSPNFDPAVAMMQVDFAENFTCIAQDEVQSFHWVQPQVTLFTASLWFGGTHHAVVLATDNRSHNRDTVVVYIDKLLKELPQSVNEVHIWSDGPASQFKNRFVAAALTVLEKNNDKNIVWNYFATSHGKGPVDGIGGGLKRSARSAVLSRRAVVFNAYQFAKAAEKSSKVKVIYLENEEIENTFKMLKFQEVFDAAPTVPGMSKCHIMFNNNNNLQISAISANEDKAIKPKQTFYEIAYGSNTDSDSESDIPLSLLKNRI